jgi:hypothetical protein
MAQIADATYRTVAGEVLATIRAPGVTRPMMIAFSEAVSRALREKTRPEELAQEVEMINPTFGPLVRKSARGDSNWLPILALIFWTIQSIVSISIKLDVKMDVNQLFDQWMNAPPRAVAPPEPPTPEPPSPDRPEMEPRQDQPPP